MVVEIAVGWMSGSMALLADGWHMATHTLALGVSALAYWLARRWAHDQRYSFGTGKVGELAGFASALALAIVAIGIAVESAGRLFEPRSVDYRDAILVAVLGLIVNLVSAALLHDGHGSRARPMIMFMVMVTNITPTTTSARPTCTSSPMR